MRLPFLAVIIVAAESLTPDGRFLYALAARRKPWHRKGDVIVTGQADDLVPRNARAGDPGKGRRSHHLCGFRVHPHHPPPCGCGSRARPIRNPSAHDDNVTPLRAHDRLPFIAARTPCCRCQRDKREWLKTLTSQQGIVPSGTEYLCTPNTQSPGRTRRPRL